MLDDDTFKFTCSALQEVIRWANKELRLFPHSKSFFVNVGRF